MLTKYFKRKEFKNTPSIQLVKELNNLRISTGSAVTIVDNDFNSADIENNLVGDYPLTSDESAEYGNIEVYGHDNDNHIANKLLHSPDPNLTERIITIALMQVGFKEGANNDNPFGQYFNINNASWCSFFVHWVLVKAGAIKQEDLNYSFGSARQTFAQFKTARKEPETFNSGELIVWGKKDSWQGHIGLILANDRINDIIYTVEGNISNKVKIKKYFYNKLGHGHYEFLGVGKLDDTLHEQYDLDYVFAKYESIEENKGEGTR